MAYKYSGDATLGLSLNILTPKPLDIRAVVDSLDELYSIPLDTAYLGMVVACVSNGNTYMLTDKSKINSSAGWKASYESIQIITCTQDEYEEWSANTNDNFKPINESKTYLHEDTYYYIYEDSLNEDLFYLSASWGKSIEESLKQKALNSTVVSIRQDLDEITEKLNNYSTSEELISNYAKKSDIDIENSESVLSKALSGYYTKDETDDIFVTKESLRGEGMEGDDFVFVTKSEYETDLKSIQEELDKTVKLDGEGSLESITVKQIKSVSKNDELLIVDVKSNGLYINDDKLATYSEVPKIVTLSETEYQELQESEKLEEDTYYYVYDVTNESNVYITKEYLDLSYHTINLYLSYIANNYYSKLQIDEIVNTLQKSGSYVTTEEAEIFATKEEVSNLSDKITEEFVTKESLRGSDTDSDDFIFVTQNKYSQDLIAQAKEFTTETLNANNINGDNINIKTITVSETVISESNGELLANDDKIALTKEIPKVVCIADSEYNELSANNELNEDTYYCTYGEKDLLDTGYVRSETLYEKFYTKTEVEELIANAIEQFKQEYSRMNTSDEQLIIN